MLGHYSTVGVLAGMVASPEVEFRLQEYKSGDGSQIHFGADSVQICVFGRP